MAFNFYSSGLWNDEYKNGKKHFVCQYKGIWYLNILIGEPVKKDKSVENSTLGLTPLDKSFLVEYVLNALDNHLLGSISHFQRLPLNILIIQSLYHYDFI